MAIFETLDNGNLKLSYNQDDELALKEALMLTYAIKLIHALTAYQDGFILKLLQAKAERALEFPHLKSLCQANEIGRAYLNIPFDQWKVQAVQELALSFDLTPKPQDFKQCQKINSNTTNENA